MKYLVPLARANSEAASQLAAAIAPLKPTSREAGALDQGWQAGTARTWELILASPQIYLWRGLLRRRYRRPRHRAGSTISGHSVALRDARRGLEQGLWQQVLTAEREELEQSFARMKSGIEGLIHRFDLESGIERGSIPEST